ncbi:MAG: hypothetical protein MUE69_22675 [Myxococcota bacterium]|nr:hypothetical protein [Myxococcota bacterium]
MTKRRSASPIHTSWLLLALLSCSSSATQLVVVVDTDYAVPRELDTIRFEITGPAGMAQTVTQSVGEEDDPSLPLTLTLVPAGDALGPVNLMVTGLRGTTELVERRAVATLERGESSMLYLFLGRVCADRDCGAGTCRCGTCGALDEDELEPWRGTPRRGDPCTTGDGGLGDAGPRDGGPDAGPAPCDDDFDCFDGVDCTTDRCDEGTCTNAPDDAQCTESEGGRCDVSTGCQYGSCTSATCTAGPCQTARCDGDVCLRESTCGEGESCCGNACVAIGCDDGIACTLDRCGAEGCEHMPVDALCDDDVICTDDACDPTRGCVTTNNTEPCSDGVFCNGADTCAGGTCSMHAGNPCPSGASMCNEASSTCACANDGECPVDTFSGWSSCDFGSDVCTLTGSQSRQRTSYRCMGGTCMPSTTTETQSCMRPSTNGVPCGTPTFGTPTSCSFVSECAESGSRTRPRTDFTCSGGACATTMTSVVEGCSRTTMGNACASDGLFCNGTESCTGGACTAHSGSPCPGGVSCDEGADRCVCGGFGEPCCAGNTCSVGACLTGKCATFGGVYALEGDESMNCVGNPLTGGTCACPSGFTAQLVQDFDGNVDEGQGWETLMYVCHAPTTGTAADYRGSHGRVLGLPSGSGCATSCNASNPYGGGCACPAPATSDTRLGVHYQNGTPLDCQREMTFCRNASVAPLTYGGNFRQLTDIGTVCQEIPLGSRCEPNPIGGACACPAGFTAVNMTSMMPHTDPARLASNWFCRATLTFCVRLPP